MLRQRAQQAPDKVALHQKDYGIWQPLTWGAYYQRAVWFGLGMKSLGLSVDESHLNNPRVDLTSLVLVMKPKAVKNLSIKTKGYCEAGQTIMMEYDVKDTL